jgi:disulfide bond formation protein DsbB
MSVTIVNMGIFTEGLNLIASIGTVIGQIILVVLLATWFMARLNNNRKSALIEKITGEYSGWIIPASFIVVAISVAISLLYSEASGFLPCELCWTQRIFMYPQFVILGLALWKKTKDSEKYCLALSTIGAIVAGYHFYGQSLNPNVLPACDITAGATSCAVKYFVEFGYITLPLMSLTAFLLLIFGMLLAISAETKSKKQ